VTGEERADAGADEEPTGTGEERADALLLDVMLGKLATYLRMCGYDAAYAVERGIEADDALLARADAEGRLAVWGLRPAPLEGEPLGRRGRHARRAVA
jgi:hypothetical protein